MNKYITKIAEITARKKKPRKVGSPQKTKKVTMDSLKNQFFVPKGPRAKKKATK